MKKNIFLSLFKHPKPIIGMVHLYGDTPEERLAIAQKEIDIMINHGIDAVLVENYFDRSLDGVTAVLRYLYKKKNRPIFGINILGDYEEAFNLASLFDADFIQIDSVAGHLPTEIVNRDEQFGDQLNEYRSLTDIPVLGGVRFKYQKVLSERTLSDDLRVGMKRCDGIVVTGDRTGQQTAIQKITLFRNTIGEFPLILGAGLTAENCHESMSICDAAIVGSYIKDTHRDMGIVSADHVKKLMKEVNKIRN